MKVKKIIVICRIPLTLKLVKDFYINELIEKGFKVEYWNVASLFYNDEHIDIPDIVNANYYRKVCSYEEFKSFIMNEDKSTTLFIAQEWFTFKTLRFFRELSLQHCFIGFYERPGFPMNLEKTPISIRHLFVLDKYREYSYKLFTKIITKLALKFKYASPPNIVFAAGNAVSEITKRFADIIDINHFDYDVYILNDKRIERLIDGDYCVFLDEYLPYHSDFAILGMPSVNPENYFIEINDFFQRIEEKYNLEVVIASHPKSDYSNNPYKGRKIFKYKTLDLVKYSKCVVAHASTSLSFAVMYNKPLLFIYTDDYAYTYRNTLINFVKKIALILGTCSFNIKNKLPEYEELFKEPNKDKNNSFINNYLSAARYKDKLSEDIIADYLANNEINGNNL